MQVPVGISNRHIHLSQADADKLFGPKYEFQILKNISQPEQFAYKETVTLVGPRGSINNVRVLGPVRAFTQVELLMTDNYTLGIQAPIRQSGDIEGSAGLTIMGPFGSVDIKQGAIVAQRHLHIHIDQANELGLKNGDNITIRAEGIRGLIFENVVVRAHPKFALDFHVDIEEGNAAGVKQGEMLEIVK